MRLVLTIEKIILDFEMKYYLEDSFFSILVFLIYSTDCFIISLFSSSNDNPLAYLMLSAFLRIDSSILVSSSFSFLSCLIISEVGNSNALNSNRNSVYSLIMVEILV